MDTVRKALTTTIIVVVTSLLGAGVASASPHEPHHQMPVSTATMSASSPVQPGQTHTAHNPDHHDSLIGFPHHDHREERLEDDEHETTNAAPHTLWRFDAGNA